MDDGRFDALVRVLGSGTPRRRVLAGLLASVPMALAGQDAAAKGKGKGKGPKKKKKKKTNRRCPRAQNCAGRECGSDGCGGVCGDCGGSNTAICTSQDQCCERDCDGKAPCADNGCEGTCGTCENGVCSGGNCLCQFPPIRTDPICDPGFCDSCGPGVCCTTGQTCVSGSCGSCPETPNPCDQEHFCGATSADNDEPFCYCVTSVDGDTTCTSVFVNEFQFRNCTSDTDCATLVNLGGAELVCVDTPCLSPLMVNPSVSKICMNKGCVDLFARRGTARSAPGLRQFDLRRNS